MSFITKEDTVLVAIDFQEKLMPAMSNGEETEERAAKLIGGMKVFDIPAIVTQQYTKGIGPTTAKIVEALGDFEHVEKTSFSAMRTQEFKDRLAATGRKNVVICGVESGIERISKYLMPALFILMLAIIVRGLTLPGAWAGVEYLFRFRWDSLTSSSILNAMGFTFFSLSVGAGILVTYGSYLSDKTSIPNASLWIAVLAIQAALLAGLMIMPAVFAFGLEPNAGPGLVFITVPMIFSQVPLGDVFALFFYVCLLVAALTSAVSLLEVVAAFMQNEWHLSRRLSVGISWITLFFLGSVSALSFGPWSGFTVGGRSFFDLLDYVCTNFLMPFGGLAVAVLAAWIAWPKIREQLSTPVRQSEHKLMFIHASLAFLAPLLVLVAVYQGLFG